MKQLTVVLLLVFFTGCSKTPSKYIYHVNGYWEIQEVILPNGEHKLYDFNETIDFISVNDSLKGFRKKLKPGINNTYYTSDDTEAILLVLENDSLKIRYKTPYAVWTEIVLEANENTLKLQNEANSTYIYKRYQGIEINLDN